KRPLFPGRPDGDCPVSGPSGPLSLLRGLAGWAVAVPGAGAVGAGGGGGAVGGEPQFPAPPVDRGLVVEPARRGGVGRGGRRAAGAGGQVVDVAGAGGLVAAGEGAVRVPGGDRAAQMRGDGLGGGADVQREADGGQRGAVEGGAEPGGEAARAGQ